MPMNWQHFTMYLFFGFYGAARFAQTTRLNVFQGKVFSFLLEFIASVQSQI